MNQNFLAFFIEKRTQNDKIFSNMSKKLLVFVGLSGGVDSAATAGLLKKGDYQVVGVFMKCWDTKKSFPKNLNQLNNDSIGCGWEQDEEDARQVASKLGIPFYSWDFTKDYKKRVLDYFLDGYKKGITPNPDIECNREIKFGLFLKRALKMGADAVATGHYVRLRHKAKNDKKTKINEFYLLKGIDSNKDQSYFLWTLTQEQLKHCLFPLGGYQKGEVRQMAQEMNLPVQDKPDSQGVCFMGQIKVDDFLRQRLGTSAGKIRTTEGKIIGEHEGLSFYTIGQRRGIKIGGGIPYFVVAKNFERNELVVARGRKHEALFQQKLEASEINWISSKGPGLPIKCRAKIRYRQPDQDCLVKEISPGRAKVIFEQPQRAVTPGQSIVFYRKERMLGGGIIEEAAG